MNELCSKCFFTPEECNLPSPIETCPITVDNVCDYLESRINFFTLHYRINPDLCPKEVH